MPFRPPASVPVRSVSIGVVTALVVLSGCTIDSESGLVGDDTALSVAEPAEGSGRAEPPGDPEQTVTRSDVDAALAQIPEEAEAVLEASGVPGMAITVVFEDEVLYAEGFGVKEAGGGEEVGPDTVFQLASLSKPLGATVVAGLVGQGVLDWDDPVVDHLPDFALSDPFVTENVTIADLYSHRSGLPDHAGDLLEDLGYDREEILVRLAQQPLDPFRDNYAYTNFGLTAAAEAAATAAGMTWEEATESVLFGPAGMEDTSPTLEGFLDAEDRAEPHVRDADGEWESSHQRDPDPESPAGGVSSTATDLGAWLRIQLNEGRLGDEEIVGPEALVQMQTPHSLSADPRTPSARSGFYGLGLSVSTRDDGYTTWSHSGAFLLGTATTVGMIPGQRVGVAAITNGQPVGAPEAMVQIVLDLISTGEVTKDWYELFSKRFEALYEPQTPTDWSEEPGDPAQPAGAATYVGSFDNDYYGTLEVTEDDGDLVMTMGPEAMEFQLEPYDGNTFLFTPPGENALGPTGIVFNVNNGTATSVTAEFYDETGLGTWERAV